jgi:hypothetical protein
MIRKTIYLLNVDGYAPDITALTYPLIRFYADRIGAGIRMITKRRFPDWPPVYEKLQIFDLAQRYPADWHIYIDSDALVHPETVDFTEFLPRDTVAHYGVDMANVRWKYDDYFRRDGRNIGSCNWLAIASSWCLDLWRPLEDLTLAQAVANIYPTVNEHHHVITAEHLIDDYVLSRNIARFGLKFETIQSLNKRIGIPDAVFFHHQYTLTPEQKLATMHEALELWKVPDKLRHWS